jgi:outer membrane protein
VQPVMKTLLGHLVMLALTACLAAPATQAQSKIGFVNIDSVLVASVEAQAGNEKLAEMSKSFETEFGQMQEELQKKFEDYQNKQSLLSETARQQREQEIGDLQVRLQQYAEEKQREVTMTEQGIRAPIVEKVRDIIADLGKTNKYDIIIPVALYVSDGFTGDLTVEVITRLNAAYK